MGRNLGFIGADCQIRMEPLVLVCRFEELGRIFGFGWACRFQDVGRNFGLGVAVLGFGWKFMYRGVDFGIWVEISPSLLPIASAGWRFLVCGVDLKILIYGHKFHTCHNILRY